jgi:hypothetical protein
MGERTVRLCDIPDSAGKLCEGSFKAVCSLCDRDVCNFHMSGAFLSATIAASTSSQQQILGFTNTEVCGRCREVLSDYTGARARPEFGQLARSILPALIQTARALLAEKKLTESKG